jgi:membrane-associated protease RseP (regulator of RpoE activity)
MSFWSEYGTVIAFYAIIITLVYVYRKKFEFQGKFIALLKTKIGIGTMHKWGYGATKFFKVLSYIGVIVGFIGMLFAVFIIFEGLYKLFFVADAPPSFSPVIPGVKIPGAAIFIPFWYGIIALFVVIVVHEFAHGVVSAAYKIKVKKSGVGMFGPIPLAFVEPDEKQLTKSSKLAQLSVYAAGPWSNILLTILLIVLFGFTPLISQGIDATYKTNTFGDGVVEFNRKVSIVNFFDFERSTIILNRIVINPKEESPAQIAGIPQQTIITRINAFEAAEDFDLFYEELSNLPPNITVTLANESHEWQVTTVVDPDNHDKGLLGVLIVERGRLNEDYINKLGVWFDIGRIVMTQLMWIILLSLGIGLMNLMPLGPVDGGKMFLIALTKFLPEKRAMKVWTVVSLFLFASIIILIFVPIIRAVTGL